MKKSEITDEQILKEMNVILSNPQLRQCNLCANSNEDCSRCSKTGIALTPWMYAGVCPHYETHEERIIKQMREALKEHEKEQRKINYLLTMSLNCLETSMLFMEDFANRVESEYKRAEAKGVGDARVRRADRAWISNYKKASKTMQNHLEGVYKQYNHFIMPILNKVFFNKEKGEYDVTMYDDHMSDSWELAHLVLRYFDVAFENTRNADALLNIMKEMKGSGVLEDKDYQHYQYIR